MSKRVKLNGALNGDPFFRIDAYSAINALFLYETKSQAESQKVLEQCFLVSIIWQAGKELSPQYFLLKGLIPGQVNADHAEKSGDLNLSIGISASKKERRDLSDQAEYFSLRRHDTAR